jgi:hypothetical protein
MDADDFETAFIIERPKIWGLFKIRRLGGCCRRFQYKEMKNYNSFFIIFSAIQ